MNKTIPLVTQNTVPHIYIADHQNAPEAGWDSDCDCGACVEQVGFAATSSLFTGIAENHNHLPDRVLMLAGTLLVKPVNDHFFVFNLAEGLLVVLDRPGYNILQAFSQPTGISDVLSQSDPDSKSSLGRFLHLLYGLNLLREIGSASKLDITSRQDTFAAWLHLNNQCNLRCSYCYIDKSAQRMSAETTKAALENIFAAASAGGYRRIKLKYAGGEPTLAAEAVIQTHLLAEQMGELHQIAVEGNILTNGLAIPERLLTFSSEHSLKWAVSLDGLGSEHDRQRPLANGGVSSQRVLASIAKLQKHGLSPFIPITLTSRNLAGLPALIEFLLARDLHFSLNFYRQSEYSLDRKGFYPDNHSLIHTLEEAYRVIEDNLPHYSLLSLLLDRVNFKAPHLYPCGAGHNYMAVGHLGNMVPCQMLVSQPDKNDFKNVAITAKNGCSTDCPWQYFCAGGCPIEAFHAQGQYTMASPYCQVYRTLAPQVLRLEALRILKYEQPIPF